jgi:arsenate reductase
VDLFKSPPSAAELEELCSALGVRPRDILRTKDPAYESLGLASGKQSDRELYAAMAANPGLIQRPIGRKGKKAVVGRPVEALASLVE